MFSHHIRACIALALTAGIACPAAQAAMDCAVAKSLATRSYNKAREAIEAGKDELAYELKDTFWDIEAYSRHCKAVRTLASRLTSNGLGRDAEFIGPDDSSSFSGTSRAAGNNQPVNELPAADVGGASGGSGASGATGSGASGSAGNSGSTGASSPNERRP